MTPKFSLVVATLGRSVEIERLFESFLAQTHPHFEVLVVDQNEDDRVSRIVKRYQDRLSIRYLRSEKGLSRARNVGLGHVTGDLVAFPDDDCWYPPGVLQQVVEQFERDPGLDGVTGCSVDGEGRLSQGRWSPTAQDVTPFNVWTSATSYTIFLRAQAVRRAGGFNESLGVGSGTRWGAGEEVNYLLGVIRGGSRVSYDPGLRIHHPEPLLEMNDKAFSRARLYNRGFGRVLGLNRYPAHFVLYLIARSAAGCVVSLLRFDPARARYYWIAASQRLLGWID